MGKRLTHIAALMPVLALIALLLTGFAKQPITSLDQLAQPGTLIAVGLGAPVEAELARDYPDAKLIPYGDRILAFTDVAMGRVDAYVDARREMEFAIQRGFSGVRLLDENYTTNRIAVGSSPVSPIPDLRQKLNAFIAQRKADGDIKRFSDLEDKRIGVATGSVQALQAEARFPNARLYYFSTTVDMLNALRAHKIDAFADAEPLVRYIMAENPDLTVLDEPLGETMQVGAIFPKTARGRELCDEYSAFIRQIRQNGVYDEIQEAWLGGDESKRAIPDPDQLPATRGILRLAVDTTVLPFAFIEDGKPAGVDIDMAVRFCRANGYGLKIVQTDFAGILPAVVAGKVDFACGGIAYTPERAQSVLYSERTYEGGSVIAVLKAKATASPTGSGLPLWNTIASSFSKTFIREDRWKLFLRGVLTTLCITLLSILFGTALGFAVFMLCRNGNPVADLVTRFSLWLVQGMPVVVLLMILYYVIFGSVAINGIAVAVIGFALTFGGSVFGMLKMGVGAVDDGQYEAAYALGYSNRRTFFRVILPQALPHVLPAYKGDIVGLIKSTAIVGYIAVQDLTKMGDIVRSRTYEAFFPLIAVTVIYFLLEGLLGYLVSRITINLDFRRRKPEDILKGIRTD